MPNILLNDRVSFDHEGSIVERSNLPHPYPAPPPSPLVEHVSLANRIRDRPYCQSTALPTELNWRFEVRGSINYSRIVTMADITELRQQMVSPGW
ncbi:hypothetical protein RRG08_048388 [Elysia crispata]|uniref:Uncharacterized protein n=1 Tax=Elysia crispata TaxID=231223 RepID=A0AAE1BAE9_9GAST|nr:hypothetical protein RRG08_048388 [Elysia crispata]